MPKENLQNILAKILATINIDKTQIKEELYSSFVSPISMKIYFQNKYPDASEEYIMKRVLDHMKTEFFQIYSNKEDTTMKSSSSQGSQDSTNRSFLFGIRYLI